MKSLKRASALIFALILLAMILSSAAVIAAEAGHDCSGFDCPVCQLVYTLNNTVRYTAAGLIVILYLSMTVTRALSGYWSYRIDRTVTPVSDKVRLLN